MLLEIVVTIIGCIVAFNLLLNLFGISQLIGISQQANNSQIISKLNADRLGVLERLVFQIHSIMMTDSMDTGEGPPTNNKQFFGTQDGKHIAGSMDELIKKIMNDPEYRKQNPDDIKRLKDIFEKEINKEDSGEEDDTGDSPNDEPDTPPEESPDDDKPWLK